MGETMIDRCWCGSPWPCERPERHLEVTSSLAPAHVTEPLIPASIVRAAVESGEPDFALVEVQCPECDEQWSEDAIDDGYHTIKNALRDWL